MRSCSWITGLVIVTLISVTAAGEMVADGSVAYWRPIALLENALESSQQELRTPGLAVALGQEPSQTRISCNKDKECEHLNRRVVLDQPVCIDQAHTFENIYSPWFGNTTTGATIPYLMDKQYTKYLQTGYSIKYDCINNQCEISERVPIKDECTYACLVTPTEYKGKTWHDFCICLPGWLKDDKGNPTIYCGPNGSRYAYYTSLAWTCEEEKAIAGICGIGERCVEKNDEVDCETIPGEGPIQYPDGTTYSFTIPKDLSSPIEVAAKHNGRIIARKPISNLSAETYAARYGPVDGSQAGSFALSTGLIELVESILAAC